jgi:X-X-X-Leu-X-X-Gly heptad repeat protein
MQAGLYQLQAGLQSGSMSDPGIAEGLILISQGLGDAVTGLGSASTPDTLLYGTDQISGGLTQMKDGTSQMAEGLLDTLVTLNTSSAELAAIEQRGKDFDHFLGRAENADNQVRFLFQSKPTYDYKTGGSWITALILSIILLGALIAAGLLLARRRMNA